MRGADASERQPLSCLRYGAETSVRVCDESAGGSDWRKKSCNGGQSYLFWFSSEMQLFLSMLVSGSANVEKSRLSIDEYHSWSAVEVALTGDSSYQNLPLYIEKRQLLCRRKKPRSGRVQQSKTT